MKKNNIIKLAIAIILIGLFAYLSVFGLNISGKQIVKSAKNINTGLDISGGVSIVYKAKVDSGVKVSEEDLKKAEAVIRKRLEAKNIFDYIIRTEASTNQISVEIPSNINDKSKDPLQAVQGLDKTAKIEFRDPEGNVLLSGNDIKSAAYSDQSTDNTGLRDPHVVLTFSDEGTKKFAAATEKLVGKTLSIYLDNDLITAPTVNNKIDSSTAIITMGKGTNVEKKATATQYAMLIDSGALPFSLEVVNKEYIGPYIGQKALDVSIQAGLVTIIILAIFLISIYRLPGLTAMLALIAYVSLVLIIMSNTGISLTLPGIAGLILSIGMAVDANVIIFERLKEELKQNIGVSKAFDRSFKRALGAIVDGNTTTFIIAILLYLFGIGPVKGFGIVLAIGVVISLFTAVTVTKFILKQFLPVANKNTFSFGIKKEAK
ncbi:MAG: protein translocase subunit SecD [Clostridia bacterium]|nr:protein translocase subunit SecD [Clostridia bacterium]